MSDEMKQKVRQQSEEKTVRKLARSLVASLAFVLFCGTSVCAGYYIYNKMMVNDEVLPELDAMYNIKAQKLDMEPNEYGTINGEVESYDYIQNELGIKLLNSNQSFDNPYMQVNVQTDNEHFVILSARNYILGDTDNFVLSEEGFYQYEHGEEYYTPVSLEVDIMLSEEQEQTGWETDYLGYYKFTEQYVSEQGYKVNIIEDTIGSEIAEDFVSEKSAVFVADGIRYTIKGRTSIDNIKEIVDSMK